MRFFRFVFRVFVEMECRVRFRGSEDECLILWFMYHYLSLSVVVLTGSETNRFRLVLPRIRCYMGRSLCNKPQVARVGFVLYIDCSDLSLALTY